MTPEQFESVYKINVVFDKCLDFIKAVDDLTEDEKIFFAKMVKKWKQEDFEKMEATTELKSCPFCGSKVRKLTAPIRGTQMFVCKNCGADVCFYGGEYEPKATEKWNRRVE